MRAQKAGPLRRRNLGMQNTLKPTPCTCSEFAGSLSELCEACTAEYEQWLDDEAARKEVRNMSSAELFGQMMEAELELCSPQLQRTAKKLREFIGSAA